MAIKNRERRLEYQRTFSVSLYSQRKSEGLCVHCGEPARPGKTQCQYCFKHRAKRLTRNRQALKRKAVEYLGGKCLDCGIQTDFISVYDFHHENADDKDEGIAELMSRFKVWEKIQVELDKCVLLCANCHRIRHEREGDEPP